MQEGRRAWDGRRQGGMLRAGEWSPVLEPSWPAGPSAEGLVCTNVVVPHDIVGVSDKIVSASQSRNLRPWVPRPRFCCL